MGMTQIALAATLFGPEDLRIVEQPLGPLAEGMVRIAFGAAGICGSDMHYFRHARTGNFIVTAPLVLGHEIAGTGLEVNDHGTTSRSATTWLSIRRAGAAPAFAAARAASIFARISISWAQPPRFPHMQGGFATFFDATPAQCVVVPKDLPFAAAALAEPLAVCLHAVARAGNLAGKRVALFGAGPIGLLTCFPRSLRRHAFDDDRHLQPAARLCQQARCR